MISVVAFPTDEPVPDELFQPKDKFGLLVAGKNFYTGFHTVPTMDRWNPLLSGNLSLYDWEMLMTGTVDFGERCPLNAIDDIVSSYEDADGITRISRTIPREIVRMNLAIELEGYENIGRTHGDYKEVAKVWPGTEEVRPEFERAVERFADLSDEDTLTTMIIFSHGDVGSIQMGNTWLSYNRLLEKLDRVKGKKAIFVYACHSGSFLRTLRHHPQRRDYAAIASCESDNLSTNWNDQDLDDFLFGHFMKSRTYSDLELQPINRSNHEQNPQMLRYFDVQLI